MSSNDGSKGSLKERLQNLTRDLKDNQAFLRTYMLSPSPDFRPAEEERIRQISRLADEMMDILAELAEKSEEGQETDSMDEDMNLEYKTHTLGDPDDADNIEGDWNLDEEDMIPISEARSLPEAEELLSKKEKKGKKHGKKDKKKGKKGKKGKKEKK
ncbi:hypothetical protein [Dialister sp.]|uniref:hypothetical protein n=1 Tax=Dialister sp. TaxID=1955814 RepID=UPI003EFBFF34